MFENVPYEKYNLTLWNNSDDFFKGISYIVKKVKVIIYEIAFSK